MRTTHNSHLRCRDAVAFGLSEYRLLQLAASCVVCERHGVAEAILRRARLYDLPLLPALPCKPISADNAKTASASATPAAQNAHQTHNPPKADTPDEADTQPKAPTPHKTAAAPKSARGATEEALPLRGGECATIDGHVVLVGTLRFMRQNAIDVQFALGILRLFLARGYLVRLVAVDGCLAGVLPMKALNI